MALRACGRQHRQLVMDLNRLLLIGACLVAWGAAAESVTYTKQQRINSAAKQFLLSRKQWCRHPCRFDVVAISGAEAEHIDWIKDAFRPEG